MKYVYFCNRLFGSKQIKVYISEMTSHLYKLFADHSKIISTIRNKNDLVTLQSDLDKLVDWAKIWKMKFNN